MTRDEVIKTEYGDLERSEWNSLISYMNLEMNLLIDLLSKATDLHKYESYYFFLGRMGTNYQQYPFNWEPFRDFAGPLLRYKDSIPVVLVSDDRPIRPEVKKVALPRLHYQLLVSPACARIDIVNTWLEALADAKAIPLDGGEKFYYWFFKALDIFPTDLSTKASAFINRFSTAEVKQALKIFISYASEDRIVIRELYSRLKKEGYEPWLDDESLIPGQDWQLEIRNAVRTSHVVIVCLSPKSVHKEGYVQKEIKDILDIADEKPEGTIFVVPVILEDCKVPERLRRWHWVSLLDSRGFQKLLLALDKRASELKQ